MLCGLQNFKVVLLYIQVHFFIIIHNHVYISIAECHFILADKGQNVFMSLHVVTHNCQSLSQFL